MTRYKYERRSLWASCLAVVLSFALLAQYAFAQEAPPAYTPEQLDNLVARIALYRDPLLAQVLAASSFPDQIPDAAKWVDEHHYLKGEELAQAIQNDQLSWDPTVQALLPFPSVLDCMASDMNWTTGLSARQRARRGFWWILHRHHAGRSSLHCGPGL
jgi:Protein of unknown function (DUF3300)